MIKKIVWGIVIVLVIALGVYLVNKSPTPVVDLTQPIKIGYIGPLTGPSAVLGMDAVKAVEIAVSDVNKTGGVNGRKVELISEDDQYLTKNTVSAYEKLVNVDKVKVIMVASYGGLFAVMDKAEKDGVIIINPLDCNKEVANASKNIFCLATETESIGTSLADQMISEGKKSAGIMYSTKDTFMAIVTNAFKKEFEAKGGKVQIESFNYEDKDFRTQLLKLKDAKAEGLVLLGHDEVGLIMKQARDLGLKQAFYTTGTITSPVAQELAAGNAEGTIFAYWDADMTNGLAKAFDDKFKALVGRGPILPLTTHPAYDATNILLTKVFPAIKGEITSSAVKSGLLKISNYQGSTGLVTIDKTGAAPIAESAFKLVKGVPTKI
jgi:branched-chain amino acid transport system substrate-binding protein